jgi:hypothetical protein
VSGVPARDRRLKRFRLLDLLLGLGALGVLIALWNVLSFWQGIAVVNTLLAPVFAWMSWRQYVILDEYQRVNLLKAYAVAGILTLTGIIVLMARLAWQGGQIRGLEAFASLSVVFLLGWASSWATWFWLRRGHGS